MTGQCTVNGHPGTRECVNGQWTSCLTDEPTGPPAGPTLPSRTSTTITVSWSGSPQAGEQYQLQYFAAGAWVRLATVASPETYVHAGLQPDTKYCYRIQATGTHGNRSSPSNCKYTKDGTGRKAWRIQAEFHTANIEDAGTDDSINVVLNDGGDNLTWVNYGRDDFDRGDTFKYDLNLDQIALLSDITRMKITKRGTNGWCLADFLLFVNERAVYAESFQSLPSGCRWIDGNDGHQSTYDVTHAALRANAAWQSYVEPARIDLDLSAYPQITATLRVPRAETESRLEGMIGHLIDGTPAHWGDRHGPGYVDASWGGDVNVDLDLEASVDNWFDPELDIDFDLRYQAQCSADQTQAVVRVATENLQADVDFDWFAELFSDILPCGPIVTVIDGRPIPDCIGALERYIGRRIESAFQPIVRSQRQSLPAGYRCLSGNVVVDPDANVDLVFQLQAPPPISPVLAPGEAWEKRILDESLD